MTSTLADPRGLLAHVARSSETLPSPWGGEQKHRVINLLWDPPSQWPNLHMTKKVTWQRGPVHDAGEKANQPAESKGHLNIREKLQKSRDGVSLEGSRAHSARLDFGEFINCGWTPDPDAPMKQGKSALRSRERILVRVMSMRNGA